MTLAIDADWVLSRRGPGRWIMAGDSRLRPNPNSVGKQLYSGAILDQGGQEWRDGGRSPKEEYDERWGGCLRGRKLFRKEEKVLLMASGCLTSTWLAITGTASTWRQSLHDANVRMHPLRDGLIEVFSSCPLSRVYFVHSVDSYLFEKVAVSLY